MVGKWSSLQDRIMRLPRELALNADITYTTILSIADTI